jgi:hypothetical protein
VRRVWPLVVAVAAFYVTAAVWIAGDRSASEHVYDSFSTASTAGDGLSLAYAYLQRQHRNVSTLTRPIGTARLPSDAVVFHIGEGLPARFGEPDEDDEKMPTKRIATPFLAADEYDFVARGGRIVLAAAGGLSPLEFRGDVPPSAESVFPFAAGIPQITIPDRRGIDAKTLLPRMVALYTAGNRVVVARERIGRGDLIVIADPEIFTNDALRTGNHLPFLLALCGTGRPLLFDETIHGLGGAGGALALLKDWNLGPFVILLLAVSALVFWRGSTRVGAAEDSYRDTRSDAVDLVHSLGALYEHSMSEIEALRLYHEALVRQVAAQTGLRGDALHRRVNELTGHRRTMAAINAAFQKIETKRTAAVSAAGPQASSPAFGGVTPPGRRRSTSGGTNAKHS